MSFYKQNPENREGSLTVLERLKLELNQKQYYEDAALITFIEENGLTPSETYDKDSMQKQLLLTVLDILESLSNDIDTFRSVETEFATTSEAYRYLQQRIERLEKRVESIPDNDDDSQIGRKDIVTFLYRN